MPDSIFDKVMEETWGFWSYEGPSNGPRKRDGASFCIGKLGDDAHECVGTMLGETEAQATLRARVAVLGKRALATVLRVAAEREEDKDICPDCQCREGRHDERGCEWGSLLAEAKKIRGGA